MALIDYEAAAKMLGIPVGTLYNWVAEQRIPHIRFGARTVRFDREALEAWVAERAKPAVEVRHDG